MRAVGGEAVENLKTVSERGRKSRTGAFASTHYIFREAKVVIVGRSIALHRQLVILRAPVSIYGRATTDNLICDAFHQI